MNNVGAKPLKYYGSAFIHLLNQNHVGTNNYNLYLKQRRRKKFKRIYLAFATEAITAATTLNYFICVALFFVFSSFLFLRCFFFLAFMFAHKKGWTKESQPTDHKLSIFLWDCFLFFFRYPKALKTFERFLFEIYYRKHNFLSARLIFSTIKLVWKNQWENGLEEKVANVLRVIFSLFFLYSAFSRILFLNFIYQLMREKWRNRLFFFYIFSCERKSMP